MGRAIHYCFKCSVLLREADFEKAKAFRVGDRVACAQCVPEIAEKATTSRTVPVRQSETKMRAARAGPSSTRRIPVAEEPAPPRRRLLLVGGAAGALLLVVTAVLLLLPGKPPGPDPAPPAPGPPAPIARKDVEVPKVTTREEEAREQFRKAEALPPDDLPALARAFDDVAWKWEGTKAAEDARRRVASLKEALKEKVAAAAAALGGEIRPRIGREEFGAVLAELEKARTRIDAPDWRAEVDRLMGEAQGRARALLDGLKAKAAEAKGKGDTAQAEKIAAQVRGWGVPRYDEELKAELDAVVAKGAETPPPPALSKSAFPVEAPPATAEGKAYRVAWEEALGRAAARDYEGALAALRKAADGLQEEEVRKQAAADQAEVRALQAFHAALLAELAKLPRHRGLSIEWRSGGELRKTSGGLLQADADRGELRSGKDSVFVEWSDATAASLAALSKAELRTRALFCLVEGESEAALGLLGEKPDAVPAKYWTAAAAAKARIPRPPAEEVRAREVLYQAEREWRAMETRGPAVEKYRSLRNDFAATATVGKIMQKVLRRSEGGKEYFFAGPDLKAEGTLKRQKDGRLVSSRDSEGRELLENAAGFGFYALPGTPYRAWVQVGGCCEEVFTAYWQATELQDTDPATRKKIAIEPEGMSVAPLKFWLRNLKKAHDHKKEPKSPARWEWIEVPLPKYATPGLKRVRILTENAGFGVGAAVVSSTRKAPPAEAELKEFEAGRAAEMPPEPPQDPDLIGYWSFEEGAGDEAADLSGAGRPAKLTGTRWVDGKVGKALLFDGGSAKAEVADTEEFRVTGNFSVAFWVRKDAESDDWTRYVGKGRDSDRTFGIWEWPKDDKRIKFQQSGGGQWFDIDSTKTLEPGVWTHIAAVMNGNRGSLYLNGAKEGEKDRGSAPAAPDVPLTFGQAPGLHGALKGALDEIRLYKRALTDDEVLALYEAGR